MNDSLEARLGVAFVEIREGGTGQGTELGNRAGCTREEQAGFPTIIVQPDRQDVGKHWVKSIFQDAFQNVTLFIAAFN